MSCTVRTIDASELPGWVACMGAGFFNDVSDDYHEYFAAEVDFDRTWAALDGTRVVGTLRSFTTQFTLPGPAAAPAAALTNVTVAATHRRQGLLTKMITADLTASAERGEHMGILIASEYPIYGRFGYGAAIEAASYAVDSVNAHFRQASVGDVETVTVGAASFTMTPVESVKKSLLKFRPSTSSSPIQGYTGRQPARFAY